MFSPKISSQQQASPPEAAEQYRVILDAMDEAILVVDRELTVLVANQTLARWCDNFGLPSQPAGRNLFEVYPFLSSKVRREYEGVFRTGTPLETEEQTRFQGREILTRTRKIPLFGNGEVVRVLTCMRDITEPRALKERLNQARKMEAIGTLAGGIAHDFNNILFAIMAYAEVAMFELPEENEFHHFFSEIDRAAKRAADLVKQILTFSRQGDQEKKPLLLEPVAKEALKLLMATLPASIDIQQDIDAACPPVLADLTQMHQVLINLCTNAYHALNEKNGFIKVVLRGTRLARGKAESLGVAPGNYARISVTDNGCGMPPDVLARIFEPYFTTRQKGEGTGLGLATVHGIVTGHGGGIHVESTPGKGTTVDVYLPALADTERGRAALPEEHKPDFPQLSARVLFVDDEAALLTMAERALKAAGCDVAAFTNPLEAFAAFRQNPRDFDCILTDQTMPGMTGVELAQKALALRPDIPIILCTGYSHTVDEQTAKAIGIREFLLKPIPVSVIFENIRKVLAAPPAAEPSPLAKKGSRGRQKG